MQSKHNYKKLRQELIRAIRGDKSQTFINKRLGYRSNQVAKWESGRGRILWPDFVSFCNVCHFNLRQPFPFLSGKKFFHEDIISNYLRSYDKKVIIEHLNVSHATLSRWLSGALIPDLDIILRLLAFDNRLLALANALSLNKLPSFKQYMEQYDCTKLKGVSGFANIIYKLIGSKQYRELKEHVDGFLATLLCINVNTEKQLLEILLQQGLLQKNPQSGKYDYTILNMGLHTNEPLRIEARKYYIDQFRKYLYYIEKNGKPGGLNFVAPFAVNMVTEETLEKILLEIDAFWIRLTKIFKNNDHENSAILINLNFQLLDVLKSLKTMSNK